MNEISGDVMQDLVLWLSAHEYEIESGENDFGDLRELFFELFDRNAGEDENGKPVSW